MKGNITLKLSILLFIFGLVSLEANYCIQVMSTMADGKDVIIKKASSPQYAPFNDVRVEKRGNYFVFRIGDYKGYSKAKNELQKIKNISDKAFVRKCDFLKNQTVYMKNSFDKSRDVEVADVAPVQVSQTIMKPKVSKVDKKRSIKNNKFGINEDLLP